MNANPDRNQTIVLVEDDDSMRQAIERILLTAGYEARWYEPVESIIEVDEAITAAAPVPPPLMRKTPCWY